jgi:hypothetical protein
MGLTMTLLAMFGVPPPDAGDGDADAAMDAFVMAVRTRNRKRLRAFLPASAKIQYLNTLERPFTRETVDCRRSRDLDDLLFGDDGFRDYVMMGGRRSWRRKHALTFVPPYATGDPIHVRWRREGERLVIEELAMPSG